MKQALLTLLLLIATPALAQTTEQAYDAFNQGDVQTAINIWRTLAEQGDTTAQFNLGQLYRQGNGVEADDEEALKWYLMAAQAGMVSAQNNLMMMQAEGRITRQDIQPLLENVSGDIQQMDPNAFLVQVMAMPDKLALDNYLLAHRADFKYTAQVLPISSKRSDWHVLLMGPFPTREEAQAAMEALPPNVKQPGSLIRTVSSLKE